MNSISLHLLSCHAPLVGGIFAGALLALGLARRDAGVLGAADLAVVAVALVAALAWATGPAALTQLDGWLDPAADPIAERHATLGDLATLAWALTGVVGLWGFFLGRALRPEPRWKPLVLLGMIVVSIGLSAWTGHEGGRIRHAELRRGAPVPATASAEIEP